MKDLEKQIAGNQPVFLDKIKKFFDAVVPKKLPLRKEIFFRNSLLTFEHILDLYKRKDENFKYAFFYFYRLNKGFPLSAFTDYFNLLDTTSSEEDLFDSSIALLNSQNKYHLSFATKITNLKYPDFPIIDRYVRHFFGIHWNDHLYYKQMSFLKKTYNGYFVPNLCDELKMFKKTYKIKKISDAKIIDFLIWFNKGV